MLVSVWIVELNVKNGVKIYPHKPRPEIFWELCLLTPIAYDPYKETWAEPSCCMQKRGPPSRGVSLVLHAEEGPPSGSACLVLHLLAM